MAYNDFRWLQGIVRFTNGPKAGYKLHTTELGNYMRQISSHDGHVTACVKCVIALKSLSRPF